jgi:hypothetical protein
MKIHIITALMVGALWLAGCADSNFRPYTLDDSFGKTVNRLVTAQIADPWAAKHPQANSAAIMDGYAGVNIMKSFRGSFGVTGNDSPVMPPQMISIGNRALN